MEKNLTCVSTTPEEMYLELQTEKASRPKIKQQKTISAPKANKPTPPENCYNLICKTDKCIICKENGKIIANEDVCFIFMWKNTVKPFVEYAKEAGILSPEDISLESNFLSPLATGKIIYFILLNYHQNIYYVQNIRILELHLLLENIPEFSPQNLFNIDRKKLLNGKRTYIYNRREKTYIYLKDLLKNLLSLAEYRKICIDSKEDQLEVFKWRNAQKIILTLAERGCLCNEAQLKAFDLPNAQEIILAYAKRSYLCEEAQLKAFDLPNAQEIILAQAKRSYLCEEAQLKAFELPNAQEIIWTYARRSYLCKEAQLKAFELPNAQEIILTYAYSTSWHYLCEETKEKARALGWL